MTHPPQLRKRPRLSNPNGRPRLKERPLRPYGPPPLRGRKHLGGAGRGHRCRGRVHRERSRRTRPGTALPTWSSRPTGSTSYRCRTMCRVAGCVLPGPRRRHQPRPDPLVSGGGVAGHVGGVERFATAARRPRERSRRIPGLDHRLRWKRGDVQSRTVADCPRSAPRGIGRPRQGRQRLPSWDPPAYSRAETFYLGVTWESEADPVEAGVFLDIMMEPAEADALAPSDQSAQEPAPTVEDPGDDGPDRGRELRVLAGALVLVAALAAIIGFRIRRRTAGRTE